MFCSYIISTDKRVAQSLCHSRASCKFPSLNSGWSIDNRPPIKTTHLTRNYWSKFYLFHRRTRAYYVTMDVWRVNSRIHSSMKYTCKFVDLYRCDSCDGGISVSYNCLEWYNLVNTHLYHSRQLYSLTYTNMMTYSHSRLWTCRPTVVWSHAVSIHACSTQFTPICSSKVIEYKSLIHLQAYATRSSAMAEGLHDALASSL